MYIPKKESVHIYTYINTYICVYFNIAKIAYSLTYSSTYSYRTFISNATKCELASYGQLLPIEKFTFSQP